MDTQKSTEQVDYSRFPIHDVELIAKRLEDVAAKIRRVANGFADNGQKPDSVLEGVISAYIQYTGNNASFLGNLVRDVEQLRAARERQVVSQ